MCIQVEVSPTRDQINNVTSDFSYPKFLTMNPNITLPPPLHPYTYLFSSAQSSRSQFPCGSGLKRVAFSWCMTVPQWLIWRTSCSCTSMHDTAHVLQGGSNQRAMKQISRLPACQRLKVLAFSWCMVLDPLHPHVRCFIRFRSLMIWISKCDSSWVICTFLKCPSVCLGSVSGPQYVSLCLSGLKNVRGVRRNEIKGQRKYFLVCTRRGTLHITGGIVCKLKGKSHSRHTKHSITRANQKKKSLSFKPHFLCAAQNLPLFRPLDNTVNVLLDKWWSAVVRTFSSVIFINRKQK